MEQLQCKTIVHTAERAVNSQELEFLSDSSPKDKPLDEHKAWSSRLADGLREAGLEKPASRVRDCAEALFFRLRTDVTTGEIQFKLDHMHSCHYRHCAFCQWRKSLKNKAVLMKALPGILEKHPTSRFLLLTLTVRNCRLDELRATITALNQGWKRLLKRDDWPALGWIRAVEVTRGKDGSVHPHYHALLQVPARYFGKEYISQKRWTGLWRECMRLDYDPVVDVRVIKPKPAKAGPAKAGREQEQEHERDSRLDALRSAVAEVVKYATKTADLLSGGPDFLREFVAQVKALKFLTSGGTLKGIMRNLKDGEDLVHVNDEENDDMGGGTRAVFHFRRKYSRYARKH